MKIEVYGPLRRHRALNALFAAVCFACLVGLYFVREHYEGRLASSEEARRELEQRAFSLVASNERLAKQVEQAQVEQPQAEAAQEGQPQQSVRELKFSEDGFLFKAVLHEKQEAVIQELLVLSIKKIAGRRCQLGIELKPTKDHQLVWVEEGETYDFLLQKQQLTLKITTVSPYDRSAEITIRK